MTARPVRVVHVTQDEIDTMFATVHARHGLTADEGRRQWQAGTLTNGALRDLWLIWSDEPEGEWK